MARIHFLYFDFVSGSFMQVQHGLAFIIGALRAEKQSIELTHIKQEDDFVKALESLKKEKPDIVGLSFVTNQKKYVHNFLKQLMPFDSLVIAGGVHCTMSKEQVFEEFPKIKGICIGEGEIPLKLLCQKLDNGEDYLHTPSFYFKNDNEIIKNEIFPLQPIDAFPPPDYTLFNYQENIKLSGGYFQMMLSRGCPYNCYYCSNHVLRQVYPNQNEYVRFPSINHAIAIVRKNLALYPNTKLIGFLDDLFTYNKKWLLDFCLVYKREIGLPFTCSSRVENIDEEIASSLKNGGCVEVAFGIESGDEWLRKHILNRKHSNETIKKAVMLIKKNKVKVTFFNIFALPFETKEMQRETISLNFELNPDFGYCYYFYPYPGTELYKLCQRYDLMVDALEEITGILDRPSLKEIFVSNKETIKNYQKLQLFLYLQLLCNIVKCPMIFKKFIIGILLAFRKPLFVLIRRTTRNAMITRLVLSMRRFVFNIFSKG